MVRPSKVRFVINRYRSEPHIYENELVARLPGLLITQFTLPPEEPAPDRVGLRFDFIEDWYAVLAFLDDRKKPTGHYRLLIQTPLLDSEGIWRGTDLLLHIDVRPDGSYVIDGDDCFCHAVEEGWMRVYSAANAREALRRLCSMLDLGKLPQEVMDAVAG